MFSKKRLMVAMALTALVVTGCAMSSDVSKESLGHDSVSEESLGLRKTDLYTEDTTVADKTSYSKVAAGEAKMINRAYENAPPMIPHDLEGMLPITMDYNACMGCHEPSVASSVNATAIPKSHMFDMRHQTVLTSVSNARYNCTQCHAPQSDNEPLVENSFRPDFRTKDGLHHSNLLDTLNEGVQ